MIQNNNKRSQILKNASQQGELKLYLNLCSLKELAKRNLNLVSNF